EHASTPRDARRRSAFRHVRRTERQEIQPDAKRLRLERLESRQLQPAKRRSLLTLFRTIPHAGRHGPTRRAEHLQPQGDCSVAADVLVQTACLRARLSMMRLKQAV